jgi:hypothetical protein
VLLIGRMFFTEDTDEEGTDLEGTVPEVAFIKDEF